MEVLTPEQLNAPTPARMTPAQSMPADTTADVGWLRDGGFELIRANQVLPIGYGPWSTGTAAFTFIRPDLQGWDVVEARAECP